MSRPFWALQRNVFWFCTTLDLFFSSSKISDFGLIHWEEDVSKTLFMENLTARGNIGYIAPETFTQSPDPPGTAFDVYRWLAMGFFEIAPSQPLLFFFFSDSTSTIQTSLSTVFILLHLKLLWLILYTHVWLTLFHPFIFTGFIINIYCIKKALCLSLNKKYPST